MENYPLVSIIIITMNHEEFIVQACESALQQTYPNIEIILLDNNSADKTFEKATETISKSTIPHKLIKIQHLTVFQKPKYIGFKSFRKIYFYTFRG